MICHNADYMGKHIKNKPTWIMKQKVESMDDEGLIQKYKAEVEKQYTWTKHDKFLAVSLLRKVLGNAETGSAAATSSVALSGVKRATAIGASEASRKVPVEIKTFSKDDVSLCHLCHSMSRTIHTYRSGKHGVCGKCGGVKI